MSLAEDGSDGHFFQLLPSLTNQYTTSLDSNEVKRRTRVVRIFPNRRSCLRLVSALAMEQSEDWLTGPRYLTMTQTETAEEPQKEDVLQPVA